MLINTNLTLVSHLITHLDGNNFAYVFSIDIAHVSFVDAMPAGFVDNQNLIFFTPDISRMLGLSGFRT
jgi:hypothetical protein